VLEQVRKQTHHTQADGRPALGGAHGHKGGRPALGGAHGHKGGRLLRLWEVGQAWGHVRWHRWHSNAAWSCIVRVYLLCWTYCVPDFCLIGGLRALPGPAALAGKFWPVCGPEALLRSQASCG